MKVFYKGRYKKWSKLFTAKQRSEETRTKREWRDENAIFLNDHFGSISK